MENKKGVIGIVGTLLIILMVISISSPYNSAEENTMEKGNSFSDPYTEVITELDDSINQVVQNGGRISSIDNEVDNYKRRLQGMKEIYDSLGEDLERNLQGLENLENVVERTKQDSNEVGMKLESLKKDVQKNKEEFIVENSGIRVSPMIIFIFLLVNCVVWIQISNYHKRKYSY